MNGKPDIPAAGEHASRRLCVYTAGFLIDKRVRRILKLAGWAPRLGIPRDGDAVGVWGHSPYAHRGETMAAKHGAPIVRIEDAFLRSLRTGREGEPPLGLIVDQRGIYFDASKPSDLEHLLSTHALDDTALLNRARNCAEWIRLSHLSKYNAFDCENSVPDAPYVLVIDQTKGDASIRLGGGSDDLFREMLVFAQLEHPGTKIVIKTHPETAAGQRAGHFGPEDANDRVQVLTDPVSPWTLMEGAVGVYTVSSTMGFEAIMAGHKPRVFGQPFYAGWGLTQDENPVPRRTRGLTRAQLFAGAMLLYPTWYDPYRDCLCELEDVLATLEAQSRAWREDHTGYVARKMSLWKRAPLRQFFSKRVTFLSSRPVAPPAPGGPKRLVWGPDAEPGEIRVEDGFLRSRGLGASLVPPLSLIADPEGIYFDATRPSRLEKLIAQRVDLTPAMRHRAEALRQSLIRNRLTKYNLVKPAIPDLPQDRTKILVVGQVETDASIRLGCSDVSTNLGLLERARGENPNAFLVYKPHPDVEAGLRKGKTDATGLADLIAHETDPISLLDAVDEVWVLTSLLGFEALVRGKPVTTLGTPFYAGWGLTRDLGPGSSRRTARPDLSGLIHASLIDYPRYFDPETGLACPVEVAVERLASAKGPNMGLGLRILSKAQGAMVSIAPRKR